jgi:excisionase family DNA binding protein
VDSCAPYAATPQPKRLKLVAKSCPTAAIISWFFVGLPEVAANIRKVRSRPASESAFLQGQGADRTHLPCEARPRSSRLLEHGMSIDRTQIAEPWAVRVDDACRLTGLCRTTIYGFLKSGRLRSVKVGRARLIDRASLRTLLD